MILFQLHSKSQPSHDNLLSGTPDGNMNLVNEVVDFEDLLIASVRCYDDTSTPSNIWGQSIRYLVIDKSTMQVVQNIHYPRRGDTIYMTSNIRVEDGVVNLYYHELYRHNSAYFWDNIHVHRLDQNGQTIEHKQLVHHLVSQYYNIYSPTFIFERYGLINVIYDDVFIGKSGLMAQFKSFDSTGVEVYYKRLNPFYPKDSFKTPHGEARCTVVEVEGEFFFTGHLWDSLQGFNNNFLNINHVFHFDSSMNFVSYSMATLDSADINAWNPYPKPNNKEFGELPWLIDVHDGKYVYGGFESFQFGDSLSSILRSDMMIQQKANSFYPDYAAFYIRDTLDNAGTYDTIWNDATDDQMFMYKYYYYYPNIGSGPYKYINAFKFTKRDDPNGSWNPNICDQTLSRLYVVLMDKDFSNRKRFAFVDSTDNIAIHGCMTTAESYGIVYGGSCTHGASQFQSVPFLMVIDTLGNANTVVGTDNYANILEMSVYPNPASQVLHLDGISDDEFYTYKILNIDGQLLEVSPLKDKNIDIHSLAKGLYTLVLEGKETIYHTQFLKKG